MWSVLKGLLKSQLKDWRQSIAWPGGRPWLGSCRMWETFSVMIPKLSLTSAKLSATLSAQVNYLLNSFLTEHFLFPFSKESFFISYLRQCAAIIEWSAALSLCQESSFFSCDMSNQRSSLSSSYWLGKHQHWSANYIVISMWLQGYSKVIFNRNTK